MSMVDGQVISMPRLATGFSKIGFTLAWPVLKGSAVAEIQQAETQTAYTLWVKHFLRSGIL